MHILRRCWNRMEALPAVNPPAKHDIRLLLAMWFVIAVVVTNAVVYTWRVCDPMLSFDNWLFVDTFLRNAIEGTLDLGDFLVKRAGVDHAQPLNKLVMLLDYKVFGLDFIFEGMAGLAFGVAGLLVLYRMAASDTRSDDWSPASYALMAAIAAVYFSLNSSSIYSFSLVTLAYAPSLFAFLTMYAAWHALMNDRWWPLLAATLAFGLIGDDSAILGVTVISLALVWHGWRIGKARQALRAIVVMGVALALCRGFYLAFGEIRGTTQAMFNVPMTERITGLAAQWRESWRWLVIPAASGIAYIGPLKGLFGEYWQVAQSMLAAFVLAAHAWFWWTALRTRPRAASFLAVAMMLLFYAYLAALLLSRVFVQGSEYLDQPRYVSFYQLGIVALLMMAMASSFGSRRSGRSGWMGATAAVVVLLIQVPLTYSAMREVQHIDIHRLHIAAQLGALVRDPAVLPADCVPNLRICQMPLQQRERILDLLQQHRLNIFSPHFARMHPQLVVAAGTPVVGD